MDFDEFTGTIQHRLELSGQRIPAGAADDLAASLPMEIRWYLTGAVHDHGQRFDWQEFVARVGDIENADAADAAYHAQVIVDLVHAQVPASDFRQLRDQLPQGEDDENWGKLFELVDAGGWDDTRGA